MNNKITAFISYSRKDIKAAKRLYNDLLENGVSTFFDEFNIPGGAQWKYNIENAITNECQYFITLISPKSIISTGYVNTEIRLALDILKKYPINKIFIIPIRLKKCEPIEPGLKHINWVDMFPSWQDGLIKILTSLKVGTGLPITIPQKVRYMIYEANKPRLEIVSVPGLFIPWQSLKKEIPKYLLRQVKEVPSNCKVRLGNLRDKKNYIIKVLDQDNNEIAHIWFGSNPLKGWKFDGLVRVGPPKADPYPIVWQTFLRYSDGTYRRLRTDHNTVK